MTTSGTYAFSESAASGLTLTAFGRIGIRPAEITPQHLRDAATEANLLQVTIGNNQPNLWRSELTVLSLVQGTAEYSLPARMIAIQDIYLSTTSGGTTTDRMLWPMSLFDYDSQSQKTIQSPPTSYVINKTLSPTVIFWQVPDGAATYTATVRMLSRNQDASQIGATTLDMPYIYLDVYVAGLAHRMARIWKPELEMMRKQDWLEALEAAQRTDTQDNVTMSVQPDFTGYYS